MMLVKTYPGDGVVELYEAHDDVRYLGPECLVEIPADVAEPGSNGWSPLDDDRFPNAEIVHVAVGGQTPSTVGGTGEPDRLVRLVGWAQWRDYYGKSHLLVYDGRTFLMNADGETVEVLQ